MKYKFKKFFNKKKVLITGNTGFKGSWLSLWMKHYGAQVLGISNSIPTKPSNFLALKLNEKVNFKKIDIRNFNALQKAIRSFQPDFVFHLAAQATVKKSYEDPKLTWETNTLGTINLLETLKNLKKNVTAIIITSDKVYKNIEITRGYSEEDVVGGFDPYSASKSSADIAIQSYYYSYFKDNKYLKICIARAGNVIGGGDWSDNRIIPDCIKKWCLDKSVKIRNPKSTRPWQHVLDVIFGYIVLAAKLKNTKSLNGEIFNFSPKTQNKRTVISLVKEIKKNGGNARWKIYSKKNFKESNLLQLNSKKSKKKLGWTCKLNFKNSIKFTVDWYKTYYFNKKKIYKLSIDQIEKYENLIN